YTKRAFLCAVGSRDEEGREWARRAVAITEPLGDDEVAIDAWGTLAGVEGLAGHERAQGRARPAGGLGHGAGRDAPLAAIAVEEHLHAAATRYLDDGIAYCSERGFELYRLYLLTFRARHELNQGRWAEAAETAASVLRVPRTSTTPRILSLVVLALLRARRGDPGERELLEEAWALAEPTGELIRLWPVAAARAEVASLRGGRDAIGEVDEAALRLAVALRSPIPIGEVAVWRIRAGVDDGLAKLAAEPYASELSREAARAADRWAELGSPYEAAIALAHTDDV